MAPDILRELSKERIVFRNGACLQLVLRSPIGRYPFFAMANVESTHSTHSIELSKFFQFYAQILIEALLNSVSGHKDDDDAVGGR